MMIIIIMIIMVLAHNGPICSYQHWPADDDHDDFGDQDNDEYIHV